MSKYFYLGLAILLTNEPLFAEQSMAPARAMFNYQMSCQGCHTQNGAGNKSVPKLKDSMGIFLGSQQGREYLVRVPGSANSVLNDRDLAEVLNWMLVQFSGDSLPIKWQPYQTQEVAIYRQRPLLETIKYRQALLQNLATE